MIKQSSTAHPAYYHLLQMAEDELPQDMPDFDDARYQPLSPPPSYALLQTPKDHFRQQRGGNDHHLFEGDTHREVLIQLDDDDKDDGLAAGNADTTIAHESSLCEIVEETPTPVRRQQQATMRAAGFYATIPDSVQRSYDLTPRTMTKVSKMSLEDFSPMPISLKPYPDPEKTPTGKKESFARRSKSVPNTADDTSEGRAGKPIQLSFSTDDPITIDSSPAKPAVNDPPAKRRRYEDSSDDGSESNFPNSPLPPSSPSIALCQENEGWAESDTETLTDALTATEPDITSGDETASEHDFDAADSLSPLPTLDDCMFSSYSVPAVENTQPGNYADQTKKKMSKEEKERDKQAKKEDRERLKAEKIALKQQEKV